ncbi:hypothetical protein, partial [Ciceribacter sp. L1K22]|uniref:hypothetical protein n=1 Tax=Ciceribacter sp. L1K22 TaxID=2820275 RepID=UPI001ABDF0D6
GRERPKHQEDRHGSEQGPGPSLGIRAQVRLRSRKPKTKTPPDRAPKNKKTRQAKIGGFVSSLSPVARPGFLLLWAYVFPPHLSV